MAVESTKISVGVWGEAKLYSSQVKLCLRTTLVSIRHLHHANSRHNTKKEKIGQKIGCPSQHTRICPFVIVFRIVKSFGSFWEECRKWVVHPKCRNFIKNILQVFDRSFCTRDTCFRHFFRKVFIPLPYLETCNTLDFTPTSAQMAFPDEDSSRFLFSKKTMRKLSNLQHQKINLI